MDSFNVALGIKQGNDGTVVLDTRPEHQAADGVIHFSILATLGEVAAARTVGAPIIPAALTVHLLSRARPGRLAGRGRLLRRGRNLAVAEAEITQDDNLLAKVTVTFAVLPGLP
jgi:acyl-coenzyme A thioesterase PaaI-like protein